MATEITNLIQSYARAAVLQRSDQVFAPRSNQRMDPFFLKLRSHIAIEKTAWGGYRTEFYPTYDYRAIAEGSAPRTRIACDAGYGVTKGFYRPRPRARQESRFFPVLMHRPVLDSCTAPRSA